MTNICLSDIMTDFLVLSMISKVKMSMQETSNAEHFLDSKLLSTIYPRRSDKNVRTRHSHRK